MNPVPSHTLFVKNVPVLPVGTTKELFNRYGAIDCVPLAGGRVWIIKFEDTVKAQQALFSLHNLRVGVGTFNM